MTDILNIEKINSICPVVVECEMKDLQCPYCGHEQDICHDGYAYEQDILHEMECCKCEKMFVFSTYILYTYETKKADCLNGEPHKLKPTVTIPKHYTRMACRDCDYERDPTREEKEKYDIPKLL